jgi:hypothetical protein
LRSSRASLDGRRAEPGVCRSGIVRALCRPECGPAWSRGQRVSEASRLKGRSIRSKAPYRYIQSYSVICMCTCSIDYLLHPSPWHRYARDARNEPLVYKLNGLLTLLVMVMAWWLLGGIIPLTYFAEHVWPCSLAACVIGLAASTFLYIKARGVDTSLLRAWLQHMGYHACDTCSTSSRQSDACVHLTTHPHPQGPSAKDKHVSGNPAVRPASMFREPGQALVNFFFGFEVRTAQKFCPVRSGFCRPEHTYTLHSLASSRHAPSRAHPPASP